MSWKQEDLWNKAKLFIQRAHDHGPEDPLFGLWCAVGLEMLARAVVSSVHPVLLADPQSGDNLLAAFGFSIHQDKQPKSIPAKTLFDRCQKIVKNFGLAEFMFCNMLMGHRNSELHSGEAVFENIKAEKWQAKYYGILNILLAHLNKDLGSVLGTDDVDAATKMIVASKEERKKEVRKLVEAHKTTFEAKTTDAQDEAKNRAALSAGFSGATAGKTVKCPACKSHARVSGQTIKYMKNHIEDGEITVEEVILPTSLVCKACSLTLNGLDALQIVGLGGQFSTSTTVSPLEYFGDDAFHDEPDYGND